MKKKIKLLTISLLAFITIGHSQSNDTIRGKIISSITRKKPVGEIVISEKGSTDFIKADSLDYFKFITKNKKSEYHLVIIAGDYDVQEFVFKSKWLNYKRPKHIVVNAKCRLNKEKASSDWKAGKAKLYLMSGITPIATTKKDKRFERKYGLKYYDFGCEARLPECLIDYNTRVFKNLDLTFGRKWRKNVRKEVIGYQ
ncbi:hypothetical protein [Tenacibaculum mesophilum]|uniref:FEKKY domain-containing protein n=1 Tax=Tenacibaculum mesophilum TaxID=104268 RepID=UPI003748595E